VSEANPESLNLLGGDLLAEGRLDEAERAYRAATRAAPDWSAPWFNLGLVYKRMRRWEDSAQCSRRAAELDPEDGGAWWNLGIAATALERWNDARTAWAACGIPVPQGEGPLQMRFGPVPVRLAANQEVVWCDRIDPARGIIENVPFAESGRHRGDVLLHDGEADGFRLRDGRQIPVFNEIERLWGSGESTFRAVVLAAAPEEVEAMQQMADERGMAVEDWTGSVRILCEACSHGTPHSDCGQASAPEWTPERRVGISAVSHDAARTLLQSWAAAAPQRSVLEVACVLPA
jgi:hypothetical protein